jgi:hypothetical protein
MNKGWQGILEKQRGNVEIFLENPAIAASLGFCIIWICYLRVSLLGKCTHSHGWIRFVGSLFV